MSNTLKSDTRIFCQQGPESIEPIQNGPLSGLSFVFKDLFDVQGYVTGAGNPKWLASHSIAEQSSPIIMTLLEAGAACEGRVQTDELAYSLNGQNIHYGTPVNPVAPDSLPGGSSSGSVVCVANGMVDFSIGTDTGGSIRVPASYCGVYGLRPTLGQIDLSHSFTLSKSFDTAGVFAKDLGVLSCVFKQLAKQVEQSHSSASTLYMEQSFAQWLDPDRLAQLKNWCDQAGIELTQTNFIGEYQYQFEELSLLFRTIQGYELVTEHQDWLEQYGDSLDPAILARVEWAQTITKERYLNAQQAQAELIQRLLKHLQGLNGPMVIPTTPAGPPKLDMAGEELASYRTSLMGLTSLAGLAGVPQLHLPMSGLAQGPCGISLILGPNQELALLETAQSLLQGAHL
ncbi:amidase [Marinomonas epiphytica]